MTAIGMGPTLALRQRGSAGFEFAAALPGGAVLMRGSAATRTNAAGALVSEPADGARFDHDPASLAPLGLLIEPAATNAVRNATMQGAAAGAPGTLPTNWTAPTTTNGVARSIVGVVTEAGVTCIEIRLAGVASATTNIALSFDGATTLLAAGPGQGVALSAYIRLAAGSMSGVSVALALSERDGGGAALVNQNSNIAVTAALMRHAQGFVIGNAATAYAGVPRLQITIANGASVDATLRIGLPQIEAGAVATSAIATSGAAASRAADTLTLDWGSCGVANGAATIRYLFDDGSSQDVATTIAGGTAPVPTGLARARLRRASLA